MGSEIIISFGTYKGKGITAEQLFDVDPRYCYWITAQKSFSQKYSDLVKYFQKRVDESPWIFKLDTMGFGQYYGLKPAEFIDDQKYCKWLLKRESFSTEYPVLYKELKELYDVIYPKNICFFYVLSFKNADFIKIGHTKQSIVKRVYNYLYDNTDYANYNLDIQNSYVYQTNFLNIEKFMLSNLSDFRLNKREEKFNLKSISTLNEQMQILENNNKFRFIKRPLKDLIPFEDGNSWKKNFYMKINAFSSFEVEYLELLKKLNLYDMYNPFTLFDMDYISNNKSL